MTTQSTSSFLLSLLFILLAGCAGHVPAKIDATQSRLFQLTDSDWVDVSEIGGIQFQRNDLSKSPDLEPCGIELWRIGSETPIVISFADEKAGYAVWKRLVARLGGSLQSDRWNKPMPTSRAVVAAALLQPTPTPPPPTPPPATQASRSGAADRMVDSLPSYSALKKGLADLTSCRDEKLISDAEYQRGRDATLAAFSTRLAEGGSGFESGFAQLHAELAQLDQLKKDHLLSDDQIGTIRSRIIARYGLSPASNP